MTQKRLEEIRALIKDGQYSDFDLGELLAAYESQELLINALRETIKLLEKP